MCVGVYIGPRKLSLAVYNTVSDDGSVAVSDLIHTEWIDRIQ